MYIVTQEGLNRHILTFTNAYIAYDPIVPVNAEKCHALVTVFEGERILLGTFSSKEYAEEAFKDILRALHEDALLYMVPEEVAFAKKEDKMAETEQEHTAMFKVLYCGNCRHYGQICKGWISTSTGECGMYDPHTTICTGDLQRGGIVKEEDIQVRECPRIQYR